MARTEKQKMLAGDLHGVDAELLADQARAGELLRELNALPLHDRPARALVLARLLGAVGEGVHICSPFHADYGFNIFLGAGVFMNFGCVLLDVGRIEIGDKTQIGPNVQILTPDHPRDPRQREQGLERGKAITIGRNVWIGGGAIILPGVTIGYDAIVGAGAVVTRDVAAGATVAGNPARALAQKAKSPA